MAPSTETRRKPLPYIVGGAIVTGAALSGYLLASVEARRWQATAAEFARAMPLDDEVADPTHVTNRAVTIHASPRDVWPWLMQMGDLPRAGYYSYAWIERIMGMRIQNADRVMPELQHLEVGQALDRAGTMLVKAVEPERCLVLGPPQDLPGVSVTWALGLYGEDGATRLISRVRARIDPSTLGARVFKLVLEPGQFLMERRMLGQIKRLVEGHVGKGEEGNPERALSLMRSRTGNGGEVEC